jgi:peptidoglycan/xylan/chitin deacetylase (PgdA/CDA1 family)
MIMVILFTAIFIGAKRNALAYAFDNKTYIWITIDTESTINWPITEQLNAEINSVKYGISSIIDICNKHDMRATFFLNVYEYKVYGEEKMKKIAQYIHHSGHDVQLHTHPEWAYDKKRQALWQYNLQEQIEIIRNGSNLIRKWTGASPVAHRAGGYMADNNTLKALEANNILIDSSYFYSNQSCRISYSDLEVNSIKQLENIWEIPVTLYMRNETPNYNVLDLKPIVRFRKIDIDWADYNDLESAIFQAQRNGIQVVTLFLHSFSFGDFKGDTAVLKDIEDFDRILTVIGGDPTLKVATSNELITILNHFEKTVANSDFVPRVDGSISYAKYLKRRFLFSRMRIMVALASIISCLIIFTVLVIYFRRKKAWDVQS